MIPITEAFPPFFPAITVVTNQHKEACTIVHHLPAAYFFAHLALGSELVCTCSCSTKGWPPGPWVTPTTTPFWQDKTLTAGQLAGPH